MPKTSKSKKSKAVAEDPVGEQVNPSSMPKKFGQEIDQIFAGKKRKKPDPNKSEKLRGNVAEEQNKKNKKEKKDKGSKDIYVGASHRSRKRTGGGLSIYTEEELGITNPNAGGTPLCPFDCDCCF